MSVDVDAGLDNNGTPPSWEELGHKMYSKDHVKFHTEIQKPDPMSAADTTARYTKKYISREAGEFMENYLGAYRDNMVAFQRKRATETTEMVKSNVEAEKQKASMREMMLGLNR